MLTNFPLTGLIWGIAVILTISLAHGSDSCPRPAGWLVSLEGAATVRATSSSDWRKVSLATVFCPGDLVRVGKRSRIAVVLPNDTVVRVGQDSTLLFQTSAEKKNGVLGLLDGILHIFSHRPRSLEVETPFVNSMVEGTEFFVQVDERSTTISVFEGVVQTINKQGSLRLESGQSGVATAAAPPVISAVVHNREAVNWTLYFPAIITPVSGEAKTPRRQLIAQAAADLSVGLVSQAEQNIGLVLRGEPNNVDALALASVIATATNDKERAMQLAAQAVALDPRSVPAALAESYARQARFDLTGALAAVRRGSDAEPDNGLILARLAELLLASGDLDGAVAAAQAAVAIVPENALAWTIFGFAQLHRIDLKDAAQSFARAISIDSALPLARLGQGLTRIRQGDLAAGRADIEISVALDPDDSLLRSYLGKAYFDEKRDARARRQYSIAKELDPQDPTPWFYDAIRKQTINRPVEALHDIQQSIALNDNRAVYRSRFMLDDDLAARGAALARIYQDLGFERLALVEGWKSVQTSPANFSAHRFLADAYRNEPRREIARASELLQAQLLQPLNTTPVQPQSADADLFFLENSGPETASLNEYNPLFLRNRVALRASGVVGGNDTLGDEIIVSGVQNRWSYSLGQFYYQTDGVRENNDQTSNILNAYVQTMLSPQTSVLAELRYQDADHGDLLFFFDPDDFSRERRKTEERKTARIGIRHDLRPGSTIIGTAIIGNEDDSNKNIFSSFRNSYIRIDADTDSVMTEIGYLHQGAGWSFQGGAGYLNLDQTTSYTYSGLFTDSFTRDTSTEHATLYGYATIDLHKSLSATVGLSGDRLDAPAQDRNNLNPKFGLVWEPTEGTVVRGAVFRTVFKNLLYGQTIEPTAVAGFNQLFDDFPASTAWTYGVGLDQRISGDVFGGISFFRRDLDVPFTDLLQGTPRNVEDEWQEDVGSAYLYWTPGNRWSLGVEYYYENFSHDQYSGPQGIERVRTHRLSPRINYFHPTGISTGISAHYIDQDGDFINPSDQVYAGSDQFWVVDCSVSYRLPKRYGIISLEARNLFDESFRYQGTYPKHPGIVPEQQIIARLSVSF
ncbi:MAG TPA: TonB-dependent receptor [Desulfofustis sp.]|jgi:tetratricopeptide (TPR) repeat protein|nr:TonB-dependent receptor [Desulfofustis sp.]HBH32560.1 TonB-dependent receptor [Desulfofustis sp.]